MIEYHIYKYIYTFVFKDMYHYLVYQDIHIFSFARNLRYFFEMSKNVKAQMHLLLIMRCLGWMFSSTELEALIGRKYATMGTPPRKLTAKQPENTPTWKRRVASTQTTNCWGSSR